MKNKFLYLLFMFLLFTKINAQGQSIKIIEKQIELTMLDVTDNNFINILDSIIIQRNTISELEKSYFYVLFIEKDPEANIYMMEIYHFPPRIIEKYNFSLFFNIENIPILVEEGCNPDNLFKKTDIKKQFSYSVSNRDFPIIEDFSSWYFMYAYKLTFPIYLSENYIRRLGFVPCKDL